MKLKIPKEKLKPIELCVICKEQKANKVSKVCDDCSVNQKYSAEQIKQM